MGQKITEYPQVDYWVKLTREADKKGATLPHRDSADKREVEKFGDMQRARYRSSFSVILPASMLAEKDGGDFAPIDDSDDPDEGELEPVAVEEVEDVDDGDAESA